jgi:hypothetical protein
MVILVCAALWPASGSLDGEAPDEAAGAGAVGEPLRVRARELAEVRDLFGCSVMGWPRGPSDHSFTRRGGDGIDDIEHKRLAPR